MAYPRCCPNLCHDCHACDHIHLEVEDHCDHIRHAVENHCDHIRHAVEDHCEIRSAGGGPKVVVVVLLHGAEVLQAAVVPLQEQALLPEAVP
jgi:hypothetical protein